MTTKHHPKVLQAQIGTTVQVREGDAFYAGIVIGVTLGTQGPETADVALIRYTGNLPHGGHLEGVVHDDTLAQTHTFKIIAGGT